MIPHPQTVAYVTESTVTTRDVLSQIVGDGVGPQADEEFRWAWEHRGEQFVVVADRKSIPVGVWYCVVQDGLDDPSALGYHTDDNGQPYALIRSDPDPDHVSLTLSHETLEMLGDPLGGRLYKAPRPGGQEAGGADVQILFEACDPPEADAYAYRKNGVVVSDFLLHDYGNGPPVGGHYSYTAAIRAPRQVLPGGYLSFLDPHDGLWYQVTYFDGTGPQTRKLGRYSMRSGLSIREWVDRQTPEPKL